ncbi:MAG: DUF2207 domain-containing protein [Aerococcaceae bacterium]|nr:DUF2207 domain-containing protein [Aerococcaceae bacterium]
MTKKWHVYTKLLMITLLLNLFAPMFVSAQEVEFDITRQEIVGEVQANGGVKFVDKQFYEIEFMNGALFQLDHEGYNLGAYRVGIVDEDGSILYFVENSSGEPRTFQTSTRNEMTTFKVFYPSERQSVTFVYEYTIDKLVTNYSDTAELNRKVVGSETNYWMDVTAKIILPGEVTNKEDFRAWGHGAPQGTVSLAVENGRSVVNVEVHNNPAGQNVEIHTIFPTSMTPNNTNIVEEARKEQIIAEEEAQVKEDQEALAKKQRNYHLQSILAALTIPIMPGVAVWYYMRKRRKMNPNPVKLPKHIYGLPADITPAIMASAVLRSEPNADDFAATVVDLARKGFIQLEEVRKEKRGLFGMGESSTALITPVKNMPNLNLLQKHERHVLEYVTPTDGPITLESMDDLMRDEKSFRKSQYRLWEKFRNYASLMGEQMSRPAHSQRMFSLFFAVMGFISAQVMTGVALALASEMRATNYSKIYIAMGAGGALVSLLIILLSFIRPIRSEQEDRMRQEWTGFANMLRDIGQFNLREIGSLELWEEYLVYAISLGVADKVLEAMKMTFTPAEFEALGHTRGYYANPYFITNTMRHSVASSVSVAQPPAQYSGTNTGGFGGGFSGGSSGGSGGGSGSGGF